MAKRQVHIWRDLEGYEATLTEALAVIRALLDTQPRHGRIIDIDGSTRPCECDWCYEWDKANELLERWERRGSD